MLEPPSAPLLTLLRELRLCTATDLRRCRGRVRRLATDLPAFDSVWIDALVQLRRLTPFQAQVLESPHPERLRVGPCVLVDRLESNYTGATYLARSIANRHARVLRVVNVDEDYIGETLDRSQNLLSAGRNLAHPSVVIPNACEKIGEQLVFVSRHVPGRTLTELLVRRGRFPANVVWNIGRQLAEGLGLLHAAGLAHGDIRPSQVRLLSEGTAVLVATGIQGVLEPELTPHSQLVPESYDCIAPELIGTGITYNAASDYYALGCLLWQLLAGRPPFPGGDPLAKLAAHQTRRIRDVRDFAPDTPHKLAELIWKMTSPNVADRPANAEAILASWGAPRRWGRGLVKNYLSSFERPVGDGITLATIANSPLAWMVALLFTASSLTAANLHEGTKATLLRIWATLPSETSTSNVRPASSGVEGEAASGTIAETHEVSPAVEDQLLSLPDPNAQGLIELTKPGRYTPRDIRQVGPLTIRARDGVRVEIVAQKKPLFLLAEKVELSNLHFVQGGLASDLAEQTAPDALLLVEALELSIRQCTFLTHATPRGEVMQAASGGQPQITPSAIGWKVSDASGSGNGRVTLEDLIVAGRSPLLDLRSTARQITGRNLLRLGPGPLVQIATPDSKLDLQIELSQVTCRQAGSLLRWNVGDLRPDKQRINVSANSCVFDMLAAESGLFELVSGRKVAAWTKHLKFVGDACVMGEQTEVIIARHPDTNQVTAVDSADLELEGITQEGYDFHGEFGMRPMNSALKDGFVGVRSSQELPGIKANKLPDLVK